MIIMYNIIITFPFLLVLYITKIFPIYRLLSNNQIHTIERGAFQDLVAMEKLRLNNNQIRHLPDLLFSNMINLKRL